MAGICGGVVGDGEIHTPIEPIVGPFAFKIHNRHGSVVVYVGEMLEIGSMFCSNANGVLRVQKCS